MSKGGAASSAAAAAGLDEGPVTSKGHSEPLQEVKREEPLDPLVPYAQMEEDSPNSNPAFLGRGIGRRLLILILLFSSLVTLVLTGVQLYFDYKRDVASISDRFVEIEQSVMLSIAGSLWDVDIEQLELQMEGILRLPDIQAVEVRETVSDVRKPLVLLVGSRQDEAVLSHQIPVVYLDRGKQRVIGTLYIEATLREVYARLWEKTLVILASQGIKTFLVSLFILFAVHWLVTRHLRGVARFASEFDVREKREEYRLDRTAPKKPDELDQVVHSFNQMCGNLTKAYTDLNAINEELEERVEERTRNLKEEVLERQSAEEAVRFSEKRFRDIAETVTDLFWETDGELRITLVSGHFHLIGMPVGNALVGLGLSSLIGQKAGFDPNPTWQEAVSDWQKSRAAFKSEEFQFLKRGEVALVVSISGVPIWDEGGMFKGFRGSIRDITHRRRAEAMIRESNELLEQRVLARTIELSNAKEEAEIANRSKTEFLNNMSHELRTPLNAVIGFSDMMRKEILGPVGNAQYRSYADDIYDSGNYLMGIISDILDVSKIEAGKLNLDIDTVCVGEAVEKCCSMMRERAVDGGVELQASPDLMPIHLKVDERRFMQVVINLVANAIKFTPKGGQVSVSAARRSDEWLVILVADTGIGIPREKQIDVFNPFARVESSMIREHEGVGLGLSIVKSLVEQHGGEITLKSEEGEGTTIAISFPPECIASSD